MLEIKYGNERPSPADLQSIIESVGIGSSLIQPVGELGYSIKVRDITDAEKNSLLVAFGEGVEEVGFNSVGPSVGAELVKKSIISFILVALGIILWVAYSFRKVSKLFPLEIRNTSNLSPSPRVYKYGWSFCCS